MKIKRVKRIYFFAVFLAILTASASATGDITVFVSIAPQKYFVQQIGKDLVDCQVMIPPGTTPHTYEPKAKQMVAITKAKLYFSIGIEFEKARLKKIAAANPKMKVVQTDQGIQKIQMASHHGLEKDDHHEKDAHHKEGKNIQEEELHDHSGLDPHIWLSPPLVKRQARAMLNAFQEFDPVHSSIYAENYSAFISQIENLDAELRNIFEDQRGLQFMVFHPSWGYFANTYGLQQIPVEIEGKNPKPAQLKNLIEHAKENDIKVIFVQPQFSTRSANLIAREIGGQVVFADPLAEDWAGNLRQVAKKIKSALK